VGPVIAKTHDAFHTILEIHTAPESWQSTAALPLKPVEYANHVLGKMCTVTDLTARNMAGTIFLPAIINLLKIFAGYSLNV
jgi:hypothetical protein